MSILANWLTILAQPFGLDGAARIALGAGVIVVGVTGLLVVMLWRQRRRTAAARQAATATRGQNQASPAMSAAASAASAGAGAVSVPPAPESVETPVAAPVATPEARPIPITRPIPALMTEVIALPTRTPVSSQPIIIARGEIPGPPPGSGSVAVVERPRPEPPEQHEQLDVRDLVPVDGAMEGLDLLDPRTPHAVTPDARLVLIGDAEAQEHYQRGLALLAGMRGESPRAPEEAIAAFQRAQTIWTRAAAPERWAMVQNDIGRAFQLLPSENRATCVRKAIEYHESALEIFDPVHHPFDWAWTHSALGAAYQIHPVGSALTNARAAVAHHEQALEVFTRRNAPLAWAWNKNNLGAAYEMVRGGGEGDWVANLHAAVTCYENALEIYTRDGYPLPHQIVTRNLERVRAELRALD